jgi:hypothetical protein
MRHVLATPGLQYFHTTFLFYPFGASIADHPHTALPAVVAATVLRRLTPAAAQNVLLLLYVFANLTAMYVLAWAITRHTRASILAAVVFGLSPYVAVHLLGHFDLAAAFTIPLFALALRKSRAVAAGVVLAATAYVAYYHVVYLVFFAVVYLLASTRPLVVARAARAATRTQRIIRAASIAGAAMLAVGAAAIVATGGWTLSLASQAISIHAPQNVLTLAWALIAVAAFLTWRPSIRVNSAAAADSRRSIGLAARLAIVFAIGAAPLLWQAARLIGSGEYVSPEYGWRSIPQGVDLLAPLVGHPLHPLFGGISRRAYDVFRQNFVETIGWFGIVPIVLLVSGLIDRRPSAKISDREQSAWRSVAIAFLIWALGPFLVVGGFDTGLKLPAILLRYVPLVANARMPGRAIVIVYMAVGVLLAVRMSAARGRLRSPGLQWMLIALVAFEYWASPMPLTGLDRPEVYTVLKTQPAGAVCEVPFGIGDGLSAGVGSQERRVLFYATEHEHPLVGGYLGRMPPAAEGRYRHTPVVGTLLALSAGSPAPVSADLNAAANPCTYLVVDRRTTTAPLALYLQLLESKRITSDGQRDLLRIR